MLFNSFPFLIFFPIVTLLYFLLPHNYRWPLLLIASCFFYMFFVPIYILVLFITIAVDYIAGIYIEKAVLPKQRKLFLIISICTNIGILAIFKYYNFFIGNFNSISHYFHSGAVIPYLKIILPIGLSFHTFQAMSYTIEIYRGNQKAEKNIGIYALYVMFYPQLVAGPIERPQNILHQFREKHYFDYYRIADGLKIMLWGFFKKVVIADQLSVIVNHIYGSPSHQTGFSLLFATYLFTFQIYCDFSGYSDIAIGAARVMGFRLMENFRTPFLSKSISEFWSRWHISLSTWFKDYLFTPMGNNILKDLRLGVKVRKWRWYYHIFIVFAISGFWHGANWTYIIWGLLNGFYIVTAMFFKDFKMDIFNRPSRFFDFINILMTFHLVMFAFIFFRSENMNDAILIIKNIFSMFKIHGMHDVMLSFNELGGMKLFFPILILIGFIFCDRYMDNIIKRRTIIKSKLASYLVYSFLLTSILIFGYFGEVKFIYFQF